MKIGFLFPDYASQYVGMGKELYDESRTMQEYFEEASNCLPINFVKLCFASSDVELSKISNAYVSIFLMSCAIAALLKEEGIVPSVVCGYGIGQLSALNALGGLSFPDGLYLLSKQAQFYQDLLQTIDVAKMRVSTIAVLKVQQLCKRMSNEERFVVVSAIHTKTECIITGDRALMQEVVKELKKQGALLVEQSIESGLNSSLAKTVVQQVSLYCAKVDFKDITTDFITTVDAQNMKRGDLIKNRIIKQIASTILWQKSLEHFAQCDMILHCGPGIQLERITRLLYPDKIVVSVNNAADIQKIRSLVIPQV